MFTIQLKNNGVEEDWEVLKGTDDNPWHAKDKHSEWSLTVAGTVGDPGKIYHRGKIPAPGELPARALIAELDGVAVYIKGKEIVIAPAAYIEDKIYHTRVLL